MSGKEFLQQLESNEVKFALICKPKLVFTASKSLDMPIEIQDILNEYHDIVVDAFPNEFPPKRSISHHIDLIRGESLPKKVAYRMTSHEDEEIKKQV